MVNAYTVPVISLIGMIFSLIVSIGLPIVLCIFFYKKYRARLSSFFIGCAVFILFALILEQLFHSFILSSSLGKYIKDNIFLYALYAGLAAGIFEESGRFIAMKFFMKRHLAKANALMYGAGHGGIEAIIIVGITSINNITISILMNTNLTEKLSSADLPATDQMLKAMQALAEAPSWQFYFGGIERIIAITLHIALSVLIYSAVRYSSKQYLLFIAVLLHTLIDCITVILSNYVSIPLLEMVLLIAVIMITIFSYRIYNRLED